MGVITLALIANGNLSSDELRGADLGDRHLGDGDRPRHLHAAAGGSSGRWARGSSRWTPPRASPLRGPGAATILASSHFGFPLSTTQVIAGGVMGAGRGQARLGGPLGRRRQPRDRLAADAAGRGGDRRRGLRLHQHLRRRRGRAAARLGDGDRRSGWRCSRSGSAAANRCRRRDGRGHRDRRRPYRREGAVADGGRLAGRRRRGHAGGLGGDLRLRHASPRRGATNGAAPLAAAAALAVVASLAFAAAIVFGLIVMVSG